MGTVRFGIAIVFTSNAAVTGVQIDYRLEPTLTYMGATLETTLQLNIINLGDSAFTSEKPIQVKVGNKVLSLLFLSDQSNHISSLRCLFMAAMKPFSRSTAAGRQNAMVALNWFSGVTEFALVSGLLGANAVWIQISCLALIVGVLAFYCYVYLYFMKHDPDRLQTEAYNLKRAEMSLLGQIPRGSTITVEPIGDTKESGSIKGIEIPQLQGPQKASKEA